MLFRFSPEPVVYLRTHLPWPEQELVALSQVVLSEWQIGRILLTIVEFFKVCGWLIWGEEDEASGFKSVERGSSDWCCRA